MNTHFNTTDLKTDLYLDLSKLRTSGFLVDIEGNQCEIVSPGGKRWQGYYINCEVIFIRNVSLKGEVIVIRNVSLKSELIRVVKALKTKYMYFDFTKRKEEIENE